MGFLWIAYAAGAASIPIALHFFFRSRYRRVPWAAMKFLLNAIEQTSRRLKFQELVLLLLRMAIMVLVALALIGRPSSSVSRTGAGGDSLEAIFLFDTSYSMGAGDGGKTRLEQAQDEALKTLSKLPSHSTVRIYTCSDRENFMGPRPANDLKQAKIIIENLALSSLATDLTPGLRAVQSAIGKTSAPIKEVFIFSDMQKTGWEKNAKLAQEILQDLKDKAEITLIRCGHDLPKDANGLQREFKNLAVVGIKPQTGVPRPGERVDFAVLVKNTGKGAIKANEMQLTLTVDKKKGDNQAVPHINPGETRIVTMRAQMGKAGLQTITVEAKDDDLPGDNRFDLVLEVREHVNVLVVDGGEIPPGGKNPTLASSYDLGHALIPADVKNSARYYLSQQTITPGEIAQPGLLNQKDLCILVNVKMPDKANDASGMHRFLSDLAQFVKEGHGLIIFCGDKVIPKDYNKALSEHGLLTLPLVETKNGKEVTEPRKFSPNAPLAFSRKTFNLPAFERFKEDKNYEIFNWIWVYQAFEVNEKVEDKKSEEDKKKLDPLTVVLRYINPDARADGSDQRPGMPAVIARKIGKGEVFFITTSADMGPPDQQAGLNYSWNNWGKSASCYTPFVQASVNYLLHGTTQEYNLQAGDSLTWFPPNAENRVYTLVHPAPSSSPDKAKVGEKPGPAEQERLGSPEPDEVTGRPVVKKADPLATAGIYTMKGTPQFTKDEDVPENSPRRKDVSFPLAVTPDLTESENLDCFNASELDKFLGFQARHMVAGEARPESSADIRLSREWTAWLLTVLLFLALGECALAFFCGRAW